MLRLRDLDARTQVGAVTGDASVTCLAPTPHGRSVAAGDAAGQPHLIDLLL